MESQLDHEVEADAPRPAGGETILLVEDDESLRQLAARVLRNAGYRVFEATNGEDALTDADSHGQIDLLITDVVMPIIGGVELARRLSIREPGMRVVFMSGYSEVAVRKQGEPGPDASWITKPFTPSEFLREIRKSLNATRAAPAPVRNG